MHMFSHSMNGYTIIYLQLIHTSTPTAAHYTSIISYMFHVFINHINTLNQIIMHLLKSRFSRHLTCTQTSCALVSSLQRFSSITTICLSSLLYIHTGSRLCLVTFLTLIHCLCVSMEKLSDTDKKKQYKNKQRMMKKNEK